MLEPRKVTLSEQSGASTLKVDGKPYTIKGVGGTSFLHELASIGGNTIRTWDAEGIGPLLDEAEQEGLMVVAGVWLEHQRHGIDYNNPEERQAELERVESLVLEHRNHPALLAWGIGNELEIGGDMDSAIRQINDAAAIVKRLDPNHPRMAVIAEIGDDKAIRIQNECPDIDFIGINSYGGLASLPQRLDEQGYTGAWAITEYGVVGHWETGYSPWGAPYEQTSSEKADFLRSNYEKSIQPNLSKQCLGSFAFLWGHKQEKTHTWYGILLSDGSMTQRADELERLWTGKLPENQSPHFIAGSLVGADREAVRPGQRVEVTITVEEPDNDPIDVQWALMPESDAQSMGGDHEQAIEPLDVRIDQPSTTSALITMPDKEGAYRIFVTIRDGRGRAATANLPIQILSEKNP